MKFTTACFLSALFLTTSAFAQASNATPINCPAVDTLSAIYQVNEVRHPSKSAQKKTIRLLRNGGQVALHYPQSEITELWEQTPNQKLHLIRLFDHHQRGIEYQPSEIKGSLDWSLKRQLISDELIAKMTLVNVTGEGCDTIEQYELNKGDRTLFVQWQPYRKLLQQLRETTSISSTTWQLTSLETDETETARAFAAWNRYHTTDYIDIGDNESDPFLRQMIHLGFVKHGASGFYDSEGNSLDHTH